MANTAKKKGGVKKKEAAKKQNVFVPINLTRNVNNEDWVVMKMKLLNWTHSDFEIHTRASAPVFFLKNKIVEHHGRIKDLVLCLDEFHEENEIRGDNTSLSHFGISGGSEDDPKTYTVYYDFKPYHDDEPLLMVD